MAGRSTTEMIWFAVSIIIALSLVGVFIGVAYEYSDRIHADAREEAADYYVNVDIINDPGFMSYDEEENNLTLYAKNTGEYEIYKDNTLININGEMFVYDDEDVQIEVLGENSDWKRGEVAQINVSISLYSDEDHRASLEVRGIRQGQTRGRDSSSIEFHLADT